MTSELNLVRAEAALTKAKADVAALQNDLENLTVVAGIEGILESLSVEEGQFVKRIKKLERSLIFPKCCFSPQWLKQMLLKYH